MHLYCFLLSKVVKFTKLHVFLYLCVCVCARAGVVFAGDVDEAEGPVEKTAGCG